MTNIIAHGNRAIDVYFQEGAQPCGVVVCVSLVDLLKHYVFKLVGGGVGRVTV